MIGRLLTTVCVLCLAHAIFYLFLGISSPVLDGNGFRETQTALSAYWLWRGGPWLAYETPVLGYPWSIPLEFPIYQGLLAILRLFGVPIHVGGRLLSFTLYVACLWPMSRLFRVVDLSRTAFLAVATLFLSAPLYVFWGRTVLIESCALFFSLLWLALVAQFLKTSSLSYLGGAIATGVVATLTKVTTFPAFALLGGLLVLVEVYRARREGRLTARLGLLALSCVCFVVPVTAETAWAFFSATVRGRNPIGAKLSLASVAVRSVGTWDQRLSLAFWRDVVLARIIPDAFGYAAIATPLVVGSALMNRRYRAPAVASLGAFLVPLLVFTNVHLHSYYQVANAVFALAAVGFGVSALMEGERRTWGAIALLVVVSGQIFYFHRHYAPIIAGDHTSHRAFALALTARESTGPNESLIVLGNDWSSEIPYYGERKSLVVPHWTSPETLRRIFENPELFLGPSPLGAIVNCPVAGDNAERVRLIRAFTGNRAVLDEIGGCQVFAARR